MPLCFAVAKPSGVIDAANYILLADARFKSFANHGQRETGASHHEREPLNFSNCRRKFPEIWMCGISGSSERFISKSRCNLRFVDATEKSMAIACGARIVCRRVYEELDEGYRLPDIESQELIVKGPNKITHFYKYIYSVTS
jgi:hypothetical protein